MAKENEFAAISPIDGRYREQVEELSQYFSEGALFYYRVKVEILYLIALANEPRVKELKRFSAQEKKFLENIFKKFSAGDVEKIKNFEKTTKHDMKSVEYFIKDKIKKSKLPRLKEKAEFVHFALTSEDVNNMAYALMLKDSLEKAYFPALERLIKEIVAEAKRNADTAMLSRTHGQPATPTTFGKEMAVFVTRLRRQQAELVGHKMMAKLNGATGNWAAHKVAYPAVDWPVFSRKFIASLGLEANLYTTQIEPHDSLAEVLDTLRRINNIIISLDQDMWLYISRDLVKQNANKGEVGSSTMPHKTNPISFENSEGNLQTANALLRFMADKLMNSRLQRDLSDSTVLRNLGLVLAYCLLGIKSTMSGLEKTTVDQMKMLAELEDNPEVLAEAIQVVLRRVGVEKPYEKMKELTKGREISLKDIQDFIDGLDLSVRDKKILIHLRPEDYYGLAEKLAREIK